MNYYVFVVTDGLHATAAFTTEEKALAYLAELGYEDEADAEDGNITITKLELE
jgi:hypothetical protein